MSGQVQFLLASCEEVPWHAPLGFGIIKDEPNHVSVMLRRFRNVN